MEKVFLGLGSNKPLAGLNPEELLEKACSLLSAFILRMRKSSVYVTSPMYVSDQSDFLNMVVAGYYEGTPQALLKRINGVEALLGRERAAEVRYGARSMDIDIELFGTERVHTADLVIPHARLLERRFVLEPLVEVMEPDAERADIEFYKERLSRLKDQRVEKYKAREGQA